MKSIKRVFFLVTLTLIFSFKGKETMNGSVEITAFWKNYKNVDKSFTVEISYTNGSDFKEGSFMYSPAVLKGSRLSSGSYNYTATKRFNMELGTGQGVPPTVTKKGTFSVTDGQLTKVNVGNLEN